MMLKVSSFILKLWRKFRNKSASCVIRLNISCPHLVMPPSADRVFKKTSQRDSAHFAPRGLQNEEPYEGRIRKQNTKPKKGRASL